MAVTKTFIYDIKADVVVVATGTTGVVLALGYRDTSAMYLIAFWYRGRRYEEWVQEFEITTPSV